MEASAVSEPELPVREGQVLDGKFRVERIVGEGAMGLIVEATHLGLDERVALKFLRREALTQPDVVARFAREARAAVKIKSDHVARVFDVGGTEDGTPFIVMEFLEGSDLATILEVRRKLEISEAAEYVIQACEGLTEAHAKGIVHRDIKPENLFLAQGAGALKQIKLLDFGISKAPLAAGSLETDLSNQTTQIMGSPHYMSPDQLRSTKDVDGRADIWSLGVVLFELISGRTPFTATDIAPLIAQILHEPHQSLMALRTDASPELEAVVDKCLAKDPAQRYQSPADLAVALLPFAPKRSRALVERATDIARAAGGATAPAPLDSEPPPPLSGGRARVEPPIVAASVAPVSAPPPSKPGTVIYIIAALVLLLGIGAGIAALMGGTKPQAPTGNAPTATTSGGGGWATIPSDTTGGNTQPTTTATAMEPTTATATPHAPTNGPRFVPRPPPPASGVVVGKPTTKPGDSEIRMER